MTVPDCTICSREPNLVLQSSDGTKFGTHADYLARFSEGFPGTGIAESACKEEVVKLTETADVLSLMLKFLHPQKPPEIVSLDFTLSLQFAEAVEKYVIYMAMPVVSSLMRQQIYDHPLEVMLFAIKHRDMELLAAASPATIDLPLETVFQACINDQDVFVAWVRYRERFKEQNIAVEVRNWICTPQNTWMNCASYHERLRFYLDGVTRSPNRAIALWVLDEVLSRCPPQPPSAACLKCADIKGFRARVEEMYKKVVTLEHILNERSSQN